MLNCVCPACTHLVSHNPKISMLYSFISYEILAHFSYSYMVHTFYLVILVGALVEIIFRRPWLLPSKFGLGYVASCLHVVWILDYRSLMLIHWLSVILLSIVFYIGGLLVQSLTPHWRTGLIPYVDLFVFLR